MSQPRGKRTRSGGEAGRRVGGKACQQPDNGRSGRDNRLAKHPADDAVVTVGSRGEEALAGAIGLAVGIITLGIGAIGMVAPMGVMRVAGMGMTSGPGRMGMQMLMADERERAGNQIGRQDDQRQTSRASNEWHARGPTKDKRVPLLYLQRGLSVNSTGAWEP